ERVRLTVQRESLVHGADDDVQTATLQDMVSQFAQPEPLAGGSVRQCNPRILEESHVSLPAAIVETNGTGERGSAGNPPAARIHAKRGDSKGEKDEQREMRRRTRDCPPVSTITHRTVHD